MNRLRTGVASGYLIACVLLGGASAAGVIGNGFLQLLALLVILAHVWTRGAPPLPRDGRWLVAIFLGFAAVAAAQLIPLPPSLWSGLPGRDVIARSMRLIGAEPGFMPASLDPRRTLASLLALLPPAAMFLVATRLTRDERTVVAKVLLGLAIVTIVLGAFQLLGGSGSRLRFYAITNAESSVGFFANANHVATLLLASLPFALLFLARAAKERAGSGGREGKGFIYAAIAVFIAVGIAMNGSLAGFGLLLPVAVASLLVYRKAVGKKMGGSAWWAAAAAALIISGVAFYGPLSGERVAGKFDGTDTTGRQISIPTTIAAAKDHLPVGSGLGTFRDIYRTYEPPENATFVFVNHAHNDYSELLLETGLPGALLALAFIAWWALRGLAAWRGEFNGVGLARAGSVVIGVALAHSLVDYPLRTAAIAAIVAMAAGFMVQPPAAKSRRSSRGARGQSRHISADSL